MKVAIFNTYDTGGAAKACIRLHQGLLIEGCETELVFKQRSYNYAHSEQFTIQSSNINRFLDKTRRMAKELKLINDRTYIKEKKFIANRPKGLEYYSYPYTKIDITTSKTYQEADIINLHWVADFLDWKSFFKRNKKPVIWTLHDQNPFLGGEHYAERYLGIDEAGLPINRVYSKAEIEEEKRLIDFKANCLTKVDNLYFVSPSKWLLESAQTSSLFGRYRSFCIPYGFPTNIFKQYDKSFCREVLGVPEDKKVILFVADSIENARKGYGFLTQALTNLQNNYKEDIMLCAVGKKATLEESSRLLELGNFQDERMMAMAYNAADVFVIPSLEDNLPNTMIESMLCGTPVVAFNTGGIADVVIDNLTGLLCPEISVRSLQETIQKFLANSDSFKRNTVSGLTMKQYSLSIQAKRYIDLFKSVLGIKA